MTLGLRLGTAVLLLCGVAAAARGQAPPAKPAPAQPAAEPARPAPVNIRLRELEQRVGALKEQAWRIKARVGMLKEAVLGGGVGARATIVHENRMGGSFRLVRAVYALDGQQIFARVDDDGSRLDGLKEIEIFSGPIAAGSHTLSVVLDYRGEGHGVFAYLDKYKFSVKSSHTFHATEGKETRLTVVGHEKGGLTTKLEDRPAIEFKVNVVSDEPPKAAARAPAR